ncbi:hypothetical protein L1F30_04995 [Simiduia sp. 21SJ11W-1]|uniref:hypothetical protein n=1 Tax=Simiduia sp. 21SJ11W-1 TaxID=2909669 RepID=UPI00209D73C7|nr:hypothetical protein [Simiduia sp. 21SJ11W-1]UTA48904.1 hypothetical protein L1F30_04995 [Simiduia sp. 21SJ11W-1]
MARQAAVNNTRPVVANPSETPAPAPVAAAAPAQAVREALVPRPRFNLADSKARALSGWVPQTSAPATQPSPVFDAALSARIQAAPRGRAPLDAVPLAPDAFGRQAVVIGDKCFRVQKLDDQALRGMASWEPVACAPKRRSSPVIDLSKRRRN